MSLLLVFIAGGLLTYAMRLSFIYLLGRVHLPGAARRILRFVPASVLAAIIAPELFLHSGKLDLSADGARLLAGMAAVLVAWRTRNTLVTILAGMGVLLALQLFF